MQLEAYESQKENRIVIKLVEQVLKQYERNISALDGGSNADAHVNQLLLQLKALLGDILVDALCMLDEQSIYSYHFESCAIAEIQIKQQSYKSSVWLYPHINYCVCKQFNERVLGLPSEVQPISSTLQSVELARSYTCAHVLALRLAQLLRPQPKTYKIETVSEEQFSHLKERMDSSYLGIFNENQ
uniref:SWIM-type domain-containing protein n=1 Tax=Ceratitis capitata TaxID=7213 RepID=W8C3C1_CERCA